MADIIDNLRRQKEGILHRIEILKRKSREDEKNKGDVRTCEPETVTEAPAKRGTDFPLGKYVLFLTVLSVLGILGLNTTLGIWAVIQGSRDGPEPGPVRWAAPVEGGWVEIPEGGRDPWEDVGPAVLLKRAEELLEKGSVDEIPLLLKGRISNAPAPLQKRMWLALGRAYQVQGKAEKSLDALLRASGSDGSADTLEGLLAAADSYCKEGRFEEASHLYYAFLAQADRLPPEVKALEAMAYFRLAQSLKGQAVRGEKRNE